MLCECTCGRAYAAYVEFFTQEFKIHGVVDILEKYIFSSDANDNDVSMLRRLVAGAYVPHSFLPNFLPYGKHLAYILSSNSEYAFHPLFIIDIFSSLFTYLVVCRGVRLRY